MPELEHTVALSTDQPSIPDFCACCGAPATESYIAEQPGRMKGMPLPDNPIAFRYCESCSGHLKAAQDRKTSNLVAVNLAVWGVGVPLAAGMPLPSFFIGPGLAGFLYFKNKGRDLRATEQCSAEGPAARVVWHRGSEYHYIFSRRETAEAFAELNRGALLER
jgi:hypothetical protein